MVVGSTCYLLKSHLNLITSQYTSCSSSHPTNIAMCCCLPRNNGGQIMKRITVPASQPPLPPAPVITCLQSLIKDDGISRRKAIFILPLLLPFMIKANVSETLAADLPGSTSTRVSYIALEDLHFILLPGSKRWQKNYMKIRRVLQNKNKSTYKEEAKMEKTVRMQIHQNEDDARSASTADLSATADMAHDSLTVFSQQGVATVPNVLQSLVNGIGIIGTTVLGSLYASASNEKDANEAAIESMRVEVNENEASIASLKKNFDLKVENEREDRIKQAKMECEMNLSFTEKLKMADVMIMGITQKLQKENLMAEDLSVQIQSLQIILMDNEEAKKDLEEKLKEKSKSIEVMEERIAVLSWEIKEKEIDLHNISYVVSTKESALTEMKFSNEHIKEDKLAGLNSEVRRLNEELLRSEREIEMKNAATESLNSLVSSLLVEREHSNRRIDAILKDNDVQRSSFRSRAAADAQLLDEKDSQIERLKEELHSITRESARIGSRLIDLTQERDGNREMLDSEQNMMKNLKHKIGIAEGILENSRKEVSDITEQLHLSDKLRSVLEYELSKVQIDYSFTKKTFERSLNNEKQTSEDLSSKLKSTNEILKKSQDDLKIKSDQLADAVQIRNSLNAIIDEYTKIEKRSNDLKEGKETIESLNKQNRTLEIQISENRESIRFLETDLKEVTRSLNKMNGKAMILTKDLEISKVLTSKIELEKEKFFKSLDELREMYRESQDYIEDVHGTVIKLGKEKENLENRTEKLEEELEFAKGEIKRLTSLMHSSPSSSPKKAQSRRQPRHSSIEN